ncbi:hypothetical protein [Sporosarcina limicola]|uniref:Uncharacterized protein n=1 Tax=Sporosarcina limicola TaxID=34101 RepID=A0A927MLL9_9BACL|nr:hypothetical protein [Sporosarcina limicola]MBE1556213.1 hypothetical protein [Sporosarcina limicola]
MKSVGQNIVFRQYLSLLPRSVLECPLVNYDYDKLSEYALVKSMIPANISRWRSWEEIEQGIRAKPAILIELELDSISGSQLSRQLAKLDTSALADLLGLVEIMRINTDSMGILQPYPTLFIGALGEGFGRIKP